MPNTLQEESRKRMPAILFYPTDWNNDPKLRLCTLAAQGLFTRLIGVLHTCEPYGHLTFDAQKPATNKEIASALGLHPNQVSPLVSQLVSRGVLSSNGGGILYSRRMVRDEEKRLKDVANGKKGGNPNLKEGLTPPLTSKPSHVEVESNNGLKTSRSTAVKTPDTPAYDTPTTALLSQDLVNGHNTPPDTSNGAGSENPNGHTPPDEREEVVAFIRSRPPIRESVGPFNPDAHYQGHTLASLTNRHAIFGIQAGWMVFIRPGQPGYGMAKNRKFCVEEFIRQMVDGKLIDDPEYRRLKRVFIDAQPRVELPV